MMPVAGFTWQPRSKAAEIMMTVPPIPLDLRPLGPDDAAAVQALTNAVGDESGMLLQAPGERPPLRLMETLLTLFAASPQSGIAIGVIAGQTTPEDASGRAAGGKLAAYGMAVADTGNGLEGFWHIALAVDPAFRRRGLGRALITGLAGCGRVAGAHHLLLSVRTGNHGAIALYERSGFSRLGSLAGSLDCTSGGKDEWMMGLSLNGSDPDAEPPALPPLPPPTDLELPVRRLAVLGPTLAASWRPLGPDGVADTALWPTFELGDGLFLAQLQPGGMQRTGHAARLVLAARSVTPSGAVATALRAVPWLMEAYTRLTIRVPAGGVVEAALADAGWQREYQLPGTGIAGWALAL
jgi:ribosomal protein S18 acetylase RimI-like enzyme